MLPHFIYVCATLCMNFVQYNRYSHVFFTYISRLYYVTSVVPSFRRSFTRRSVSWAGGMCALKKIMFVYVLLVVFLCCCAVVYDELFCVRLSSVRSFILSNSIEYFVVSTGHLKPVLVSKRPCNRSDVHFLCPFVRNSFRFIFFCYFRDSNNFKKK